MKRYVIEFTEEQLRMVIGCVEDLHRFAAGEDDLFHTLSALLSGKDWITKSNEFREHLKKAQEIINPELTPGSRYKWSGIGAKPESKELFIANTYQIYRELLYIMTVANGHKNAYSSPTMEAGTIGQPKLIKVKEE